MKLLRPDVYNDRKCPDCNLHWETDQHIFECKWHKPVLRSIEHHVHNKLITYINKFKSDRVEKKREYSDKENDDPTRYKLWYF